MSFAMASRRLEVAGSVHYEPVVNLRVVSTSRMTLPSSSPDRPNATIGSPVPAVKHIMIATSSSAEIMTTWPMCSARRRQQIGR
jgi:hypothetical protein